MLRLVVVRQTIRELAKKDRIAFKKHTVLRMHERKIHADEVKDALTKGEIVEDYPDDRPLPSYLVLGYTMKERPVHAVVAIDMEDKMLWIITVYEPNLENWENEFRRRRPL